MVKYQSNLAVPARPHGYSPEGIQEDVYVDCV